ncbi:hypothetical protein VTL71DRAFT_6106 [Oculimacula yallundae]|uniref:K Homology domain-containing protein n=1 Tax=Oculimacula yallundae TaxID=86028 RepID=A0ABR4C136_9HELO
MQDRIDEESSGQRISVHDLVPGAERVRQIERGQVIKRREEAVKKREKEVERMEEEMKRREDEVEVSPSSNLAGQKLGAVLRVMRVPSHIRGVIGGTGGTVVEVGDCCRVLEVEGNTDAKTIYKVRNTGTQVEVWIPWNTFLEVGRREVCGCSGSGKKNNM